MENLFVFVIIPATNPKIMFTVRPCDLRMRAKRAFDFYYIYRDFRSAEPRAEPRMRAKRESEFYHIYYSETRFNFKARPKGLNCLNCLSKFLKFKFACIKSLKICISKKSLIQMQIYEHMKGCVSIIVKCSERKLIA